MKISLKWLNDYVDVSDYMDKPQELAKLLTGAGFEVESIEDPSKSFANVVVGQVKVYGRHPNADRLTLCQVDVGAKELQQIVCGAKNHKEGDKVVAALPGAVLPGNFEIKVSKIRDVESRGMLCSDSELGLSKKSEGIRTLPADAPVGQDFAAYMGMKDIILEVNVTPNRADCLSHIGLAREVACLLGRKMKSVDAKFAKTKISTLKTIDVNLQAADLCPRYSGVLVKNVKVGESPTWLKQRLESVGMNSINNIVDITNFVMLEYGQPLHAFDVSQLKGEQITIERSKGETFRSLDGTDHKLTTDDLTIRDGERAVALAGVVGGLNSGISDSTTDVFIESAHFAQSAVRKTSRRLGIDTDSSYRFSRGTDPEGVVDAMERAASLIEQLAGGEVAADHYDLYPKKQKIRSIKVRKETLAERLGYPVKVTEFSTWMKRLHCEVTTAGDVCTVKVPAFRWDLEMEMDLVEEFARLNGYDKIPENFPVLQNEPTKDSAEYTLKSHLRPFLADVGMLEAVNYSFTAPAWQKEIVQPAKWSKVGLHLGGDAVQVKNPLSEETSVMRQSLLPGLLQNLIYNIHQANNYGRVFEVGSVFSKTPEGYKEPARVAFVAWGHKLDLWQKSATQTVMDLKGAIEQVLARLQAQGFQWKDIPSADAPDVVHPGQAAALFYQGKNIGFIGSLHPAFREKYKIREDIALAEIDFDLLMSGQPRSAKFRSLSKHPSVERDLALLVPDVVKAGDLMREVQKQGGPDLQWAKVFDLYKGQGVPEGHASVAIRMRFQKKDATYSEAELNTLMAAMVQGLQKKYPVKQR